MKGKKEDKILSDLFRQKLENAEIIPSPSVSMKLMRQVGRREFLRFNPSRFNIWYAGGIVVATATLAVILSSGHGKQEKLSPVVPAVKISAPIDSSEKNNVIIQPSGSNQIEKVQRSLKQGDIVSEKATGNGTGKITAQSFQDITRNVSIPSGAVGSLNEKGLFPAATAEKNNLQGQLSLNENQTAASVTEGCAPLKVSFKNMVISCDSCRWTFGDGGFSVEKNPKWLFDVPGEYKVTLNIFGPGGVKAASFLYVSVHSRPEARFDFTPENAVLPANEISFHNYSTDAIKYRWDFGDGTTSELFEPKYSYRKQGHYNVKLFVSSEFGCSDSVIVTNAFSGSDYFIDFPNAFFPNINGPSNGSYSQKSDEAAQVFHPAWSGVSEYQLRIFSRRGILIFESNDVIIGWDGYYKGQLCEPGVYIWKVRGNFMNGEPFTKMGDVTLLKN